MYLDLMYNGLDSLRFGIDFYNKYFDEIQNKYAEMNPGYLKMAVISTCMAIELFSKQLLIHKSDDGMIIYDSTLNDKIFRLYDENKNKNYTSLDHLALHRNIYFKSIDYKECIQKLAIHLKPHRANILRSLGYLRNKLMHFGIDRSINFHEALFLLNEALEIVISFYYEQLKEHVKNPKYLLQFDSLKTSIQELLPKAKHEANEYWAVFNLKDFENITSVISALKEDTKFHQYLSSKGFDSYIDVEYAEYENCPKIILNFNHLTDASKDITIGSTSLPNLNVTLFHDMSKNKSIHFIINHAALSSWYKTLYHIYRQPRPYPNEKEQNRNFLKKDIEKNRFIKFQSTNSIDLEFNPLEIKGTIKKVLNLNVSVNSSTHSHGLKSTI